MKLYSVYDSEAKIWTAPMAQPNDVAATRGFTMEVNRADPGNMLNYAPEHFSLYRIGSFNAETGTVTPEHEKLVEAVLLKRA